MGGKRAKPAGTEPKPAATEPTPPAEPLAPPEPSTPRQPGIRRRRLRRGTLIATLAIAVLAVPVGASVAVGAGNAGRIMPGVRIGGVDLAGLTRDAAEQRLRAALPSLTDGAATVVVDGAATVIPYEQVGRGYEWDAMLDAAYGVARDGNLFSDGVARVLTLLRDSDLPILVHGYEPDAIDQAVADLVARFAERPVSAAATYDPVTGFRVTPGRAGRVLDTAEVRRALGDAMATSNPADVTIILATRTVEPRISTVIARQAVSDARAMSRSPLAITSDGELGAELRADQIAAAVRFGLRRDGSYGAWIDIGAVRDALAPLAEAFATPAVNAGYIFDADGVAEVVPAVDGRSLNLTRTALAVIDASERHASGGQLGWSVEAQYDLTRALLTTEAAEAAAPNMARLSTWTTYYKPGIGNANGANISIPAQDVNGLVLAPGEWFDFWKRIGPITLERGYGYGGAIIGGRSTPNGVLAGGICSTSTTLFNAALRGGLEMGERWNHYYYIARYPVGLDATVIAYDTWAASMTFRNDTPDPIVIRAYTGTGYVRFDIWGVAAGRTVSLSDPVITNRVAARETTRYNPNLAPGSSVRIEGAYDGFDASVTRTVRDADGTVIHTDTWVSHYSVVNGITEVGPALPTPQPTPTPTPEPTPAPSPT